MVRQPVEIKEWIFNKIIRQLETDRDLRLKLLEEKIFDLCNKSELHNADICFVLSKMITRQHNFYIGLDEEQERDRKIGERSCLKCGGIGTLELELGSEDPETHIIGDFSFWKCKECGWTRDIDIDKT